jgi:transketolase
MDFRDEIFDEIRNLMRTDNSIVVLTNDMNSMVLNEIESEMPSRVFNIGVAEQNLMSVAGGMAQCGNKVLVFGIASHITSRAWEQIKLDICAFDLPVVIVGVGPGLGYGNDGPTHHATEDLALMAVLPGMAIYNPCDPICTRHVVRQAVVRAQPSYIRLDRGSVEPVYSSSVYEETGMTVVHAGETVGILSTGVLTFRAIEASKKLLSDDISCRVIDINRLKPLDGNALRKAIENLDTVVTIEEHNISLGFGAIVRHNLNNIGVTQKIHCLGLPDKFLFGSSPREWAQKEFGLDADGIRNSIRRFMKVSLN